MAGKLLRKTCHNEHILLVLKDIRLFSDCFGVQIKVKALIYEALMSLANSTERKVFSHMKSAYLNRDHSACFGYHDLPRLADTTWKQNFYSCIFCFSFFKTGK